MSCAYIDKSAISCGLVGYVSYTSSKTERFYSWLKFFSLDDLRKQGTMYLKRSNNIPMAVLKYLTPNEMRRNLTLWAA